MTSPAPATQEPTGPDPTVDASDQAGPARLGPLATLLGQATVAGNVVFALGVFQVRPSFWTAMAAPALGCLALAPRRALMRLRVSIPLVLLLGWLLMTLAWSVDTDVTLVWLRISMPPLLGLAAVAGCLRGDDILVALKWAVGLVVVAQIVELVIEPASRTRVQGPDGWRGTFLSKNSLGIFVSIGIVVALATERGWRRVVALVVLGVLLVGSQSWTARFAVIAAVGVWAWANTLARSSTRSIFPVLALGTAVALALGAAAVLSFDTVLDSAGKDSTFTGRTDIWESALDQVEQRPFVGYGYNAFVNFATPTEATLAVWEPLVHRPAHAHNGVLDAVGQIGLVGVGLLLVVIATTAVAAGRHIRSVGPAAVAVMCLVVVQLVAAVAEPSLLDGGWLVFVVLLRGWSAQFPDEALWRHERRSDPGAAESRPVTAAAAWS